MQPVYSVPWPPSETQISPVLHEFKCLNSYDRPSKLLAYIHVRSSNAIIKWRSVLFSPRTCDIKESASGPSMRLSRTAIKRHVWLAARLSPVLGPPFSSLSFYSSAAQHASLSNMVAFTILAGGYDVFIAAYLFNATASSLALTSKSPAGQNTSWITPHHTNRSIL